MRQGLRALSAWARPIDEDQAAEILSPDLLALFRRMRRSEQQHSLNVLQMLRERGQNHPALLIAALLHDVGKSFIAFHLWDRVIVVLVKAVAPESAQRWGKGLPTGWRRPFVVSFQHPTWGAEMVAAAGGDPLAVELIAIHQTQLAHEPQTLTERLLIALQAADDAN